jgi:saccharopine dehydrogenase-like NADP-dependent oxidoreductase
MTPTVEPRRILLLGNGFVAGPCLSHLLSRPENTVTVASRHIQSSIKLCGEFANCLPAQIDVNDEKALLHLVSLHDLVISLIPYTEHVKVFKAAVNAKKHVVTTSYVSNEMQSFDAAAKQAGITVSNN